MPKTPDQRQNEVQSIELGSEPAKQLPFGASFLTANSFTSESDWADCSGG